MNTIDDKTVNSKYSLDFLSKIKIKKIKKSPLGNFYDRALSLSVFLSLSVSVSLSLSLFVYVQYPRLLSTSSGDPTLMFASISGS
jgi:hypothetical protein